MVCAVHQRRLTSHPISQTGSWLGVLHCWLLVCDTFARSERAIVLLTSVITEGIYVRVSDRSPAIPWYNCVHVPSSPSSYSGTTRLLQIFPPRLVVMP
ncbi:hypothetical protein BDN67DRAFT_629994 [Paxillus ammoniavirescens]|nr:hypothetical protein BDN67DRAFT_629994 [Paxillus ammoniavirescens]